MKSSLFRLAAVALLVWGARASADDQVFYLDRDSGKEVDVHGTIESEAPAGLHIKTRNGDVEIAALDVRSVVYQSEKIASLELRGLVGKEERALMTGPRETTQRRTLLAEALEGYRNLDGRASDEAQLHRYLQYRIARVLALQAREDPSHIDAAIAALTAYKSNFLNGWEVVPALQLLAQLLEDKPDAAAASKVYDEMAGLPGIPGEVKQEAQVQAIRMLVRSGQYAQAEAKLRSLEGSAPKDGPRRALLDVCLVQSRLAQGHLEGADTQLRKALQSMTDANLRAAAYNLLGDYYRAVKQPEEAFWNYLRVDVLYSQDRQEHAKALFYLAKLYDEVKKDPTRAGECLRRLRSPEFAGTSYQRQAADEDR